VITFHPRTTGTASRIAVGWLAACSVVTGVAAAGPAGADPGPGADSGAGDNAAVELLDRSREAAETSTFDGTVVVEWHDGRDRHSAEIPVRSRGGVLRFGDEVVGAGARRLVHGTDGWLSLWGHEVAPLGPTPTAKYRLSVEPGPDVVSRPTDMVSVRLIGAARPRERLYVDRQTGLLLRRELLDAGGSPYRWVAFNALGTETGGVEPPAPAAMPAGHSQEPVPAGHLKAPYRLRSRIGSGYRLVGAYKAGGVVQQFYSDGLHGLSVFEQGGHLRAAETSLAGDSRSGREVEIAGHTVRAYFASVGEATVWESDGIVYTAVTDAPWSDLAGAVQDLPHADRPGRLWRVAQAVVSLFRWR
jgi:sigma-E factor negative regulatory protein RseB